MTKSNTESFRSKRQGWLGVLSGDDRHTIMNQLIRITWRAAHFRTINEARRFATPIDEEHYEINGMLHNLLDDCFFQSHMSAVRRLVDTKKLYGPDGVHSLKQLLQDMKKNSSFFTRKAIFDVESLNYDVDAIRKKHDKYITEKLDSSATTFHIPREFDWEIIEERHKQIDLLTGTIAKDRKPDDHTQICIHQPDHKN